MKLKGTVTSIVACAYVLGTLINKSSVSVVRIPVIRLRFMCPPWTGRSGVCARVGRKPRVNMERNERYWGIPLLLLVGPVKGARHNPTATGRTCQRKSTEGVPGRPQGCTGTKTGPGR